MTSPVWTAVLWRQFGLPAALSVTFHGLVVGVVAMGGFSLSSPVTSVQPSGATVDLVSLPPQPVVEPVGASSVVPAEPLRVAADPPPNFRDLPRVPASAVSPTKASSAAAPLSAPEPTESLASFAESVESVPVSRPLPAASSGPTRLLRDSVAETGSVRSRVRSVNNPRPEYPRAAREAGWEGTVVLQILVLPDGTAGNVMLHKTSGYSILDEAALAAVRGWRFVPAMDGNFPIQSVARLSIRFDLKAAN